MDVLFGFALIAVICAVAVFVLPVAPFGKPRGCGGGALQCAMGKEQRRKDAEQISGKQSPPETGG